MKIIKLTNNPREHYIINRLAIAETDEWIHGNIKFFDDNDSATITFSDLSAELEKHAIRHLLIKGYALTQYYDDEYDTFKKVWTRNNIPVNFDKTLAPMLKNISITVSVISEENGYDSLSDKPFVFADDVLFFEQED